MKPSTDFKAYLENGYGKDARLTRPKYRERLTSWQVPAIKTHFGDLTGKNFLDVGAGDIVLGEKLADIGTPAIFYAQDLSRPSLEAGLGRIKKSGLSTDIFTTLVSDTFNFDRIPEGTVDAAFSNSLFSHLSINSILLCLRRLAPKMKIGSKYLSSMIVTPEDFENMPYDWSYLGKWGTDVTSHPARDPYHYSASTIQHLSAFATGFEVTGIHDYGHPFQKLVEFTRQTYSLEN